MNWQPSENGGEAAVICTIDGFDVLGNGSDREIEYQLHVWAGPIKTENTEVKYLAALFSVSEIGRKMICAFGARDSIELAKQVAENGLEDVATKILDGVTESWHKNPPSKGAKNERSH